MDSFYAVKYDETPEHAADQLSSGWKPRRRKIRNGLAKGNSVPLQQPATNHEPSHWLFNALNVLNQQNDDENKDNLYSSRSRKISLTIGEKKLLAETLEQRLQKLKARRGKCKKNESEEQRRIRLQRLSSYQKIRLRNESEEQRSHRLRRLSLNQKIRLRNESEQQRCLRLQRLSLNQKIRLQNETEEQRRLRLQRLRQNQSQRLKTL